jgi:hypothetical protein
MVAASGKRALIVAIGSYPEDSGWHNINAENDAVLMRDVLMLQGFNKKQITTLSNEKATKKNILKSLETLISNSEENDVVVFHFSGHGQQITDSSGDELDGYDEALVPYDAFKTTSNKYNGENHLKDDELNTYLTRLRKKVGQNGDVVFILDACHSGTATRGNKEKAVFRGTDKKFDIANYKLPILSNDNDRFDEQMKYSEISNNKLSPYIFISASGQQELNLEIKDQNNVGYGSLTYAIGVLMNTNCDALSYTAFFDLLRNEMCANFAGRHQQTPQMEGQTDRLFFAGKAVAIPSHCRVMSVVNSTKLMVNIGELNGLTKGSEISFYPINTFTPKNTKLLAKGSIKDVGTMESTVSFDSPISKKKLKDSWGFVTKYNWVKVYPGTEEMRADIIRRASSKDSSLNVEFEILSTDSPDVNSSNNTFYIGEKIQLRISNKGTKDAYFQIIDIQSNNQVSLITDNSYYTNDDLFIKAGETIEHESFKFTVGEPAGVEMIKLIASDKQLDLSPIITQKPKTNRSMVTTQFEQFVNDLYRDKKTRSASAFYEKINIYTQIFTIKEK